MLVLLCMFNIRTVVVANHNAAVPSAYGIYATDSLSVTAAYGIALW